MMFESYKASSIVQQPPESGAPGAIRTPGLLIRSQIFATPLNLIKSIVCRLWIVPQIINLPFCMPLYLLDRLLSRGTAFMRCYDTVRLYELDLSDSHLSQEEIGEYLLRLEADRKREIEKERARRAKRTNFRFCGGM